LSSLLSTAPPTKSARIAFFSLLTVASMVPAETLAAHETRLARDVTARGA
jgi:hypothetical protein